MNLRDRLAAWLRPAVYLGENPLTLAGAVLTTSAAITLIGFWIHEIVRGGPVHPYAGIVFFLILPGIFLLGLVLMPVGALLRRTRLKRRGQLPASYPQVDLRDVALRRAGTLVAGLTFVNVCILAIASYRGVEYMDSQAFCGTTCHTVMAPEYISYLRSPHARVACVECHIGPGAPWFVKAKISGARQLLAVNLKTYSRPIPSPVRELRPARDTCEQCHWPQRFIGDKFLVRTKYADDETSTPLTTVLVLKLGGKTFQGRTGIHGRHIDSVERVSYTASDAKRQVIPTVTYLDDAGKTVEYVSTEGAAAARAPAKVSERRTMDCMDCHNRPTHIFKLPERAVDEAIADGRISRELPFVKKKCVEVLRAESAGALGADERIANSLTSFYKTTYPGAWTEKRALVEAAVRATQDIYKTNVFPEMKITWGTYPNNLGHDDFPGCFRCHDGNHKAADGRVITAECDACHGLLAQDEANPKILADLGLK